MSRDETTIKNAKNTDTKEMECSICLEKIKSDNIVETVCHHSFHNDCIITWKKQNKSCPMCRAVLVLLQPSLSLLIPSLSPKHTRFLLKSKPWSSKDINVRNHFDR